MLSICFLGIVVYYNDVKSSEVTIRLNKNNHLIKNNKG